MTDLLAAIRTGDVPLVTSLLVGSTTAERRAVRDAVLALPPDRNSWGTLVLAKLGVGRWGDVRRLTVGTAMGIDEAVVAVFDAVRPDWASKWVKAACEHANPAPWKVVHGLVERGIAEVPADPTGYARAFAWWVLFAQTDEIAADVPLEQVWQLFELDCRPFDVWGGGDSGVHRLLAALVRDGRVPRAMALERTLLALTAGMHRTQLTAYTTVHTSLAPTPIERVALADRYLDLLAHPEGPVVGFALDALRAIDGVGALDDDAFGHAVIPVFSLKPMNHPKAALALLERVARRRPEAAAAGLVAALAHPAPAVQERATDLLEVHATPGTVAALAGRTDRVTASQRPRVEALVGAVPERTPAPVRTDVPLRWSTLAGIDRIDAGELAPLTFGPLDVPRLDRDRPVTPIASLDELYDTISVAIERIDALAFERVLDGVSRFGPNLTADRLDPLVKRLSARTSGFADAPGLTSELERLLGVPSMSGYLRPWPALRFLSARVTEVVDRMRAGGSAPRLALPTDPRGFLDPRVWVERLVSGPRDRADRIQAMLRLAPEGRDPSRVPEDLAAERYAAGGPLGEVDDPDLWLAAARARDPLGEIPVTGIAGPDGTAPAKYRVDVGKTLHVTSTTNRLGLVPQSSPMPVGLHGPSSVGEYGGSADVLHALMVWPARPHAVMAGGVPDLDRQRDTGATFLSPLTAYVGRLLDPGLILDDGTGDPVGVPLLVAAIGLVHADPAVKGLTVDALAAAIVDGRCADGALGRALGFLVEHGRVKLNRVATGLTDVARTGVLARWVCADIATELVAGMKTPPRDLHHALEVLRELLVGSGRPVDPRCRGLLEPLVGRSKTGRLAAELLRLEGTAGVPSAVLAEARAGRVARAKTWED